MSTPPEKPRRRWFRMSVRMMMLLVLIIGVLVGWRVNRANTQRRAVAAIKKAGGEVEYDYQSNSQSGKPWAPVWLRRQLGDEYFQEVECATLSSSATDATLASLEGCDRLKELHIIADPSKIGDGLMHLRRLVSLETLHLGGPGITDAGLAHLRGMHGLKCLYLRSTKVTDAGLAHLEGLTELRILSIQNPPIRNPGLGPKLRALRVVGNPLTDAGLVHLSGLHKLRQLEVCDAPGVTDLGPLNPHQNLPELETIWLDRTGMTDAGIAPLERMVGLWSLRLSDTKVTDAGLVHLRGLSNLSSLSLDHNKGITDAGLVNLRGLVHLLERKKLGSLHVRGTGVSDEGLAGLQSELSSLAEARRRSKR